MYVTTLLVLFIIKLTKRSLFYTPRFYEKANWSNFQTKVESKLNENPFIFKTNQNALDENMNFINNILQQTMDEISTLTKITHKSKIPWNNEI